MRIWKKIRAIDGTQAKRERMKRDKNETEMGEEKKNRKQGNDKI